MRHASDPFWAPALRDARRSLNSALRGPLVSALCAPRSVDDYLELLDPTWSVRRIRARVVGVVPEADSATSLLLAPNENWSGFRAGQFVPLSSQVGGVRYTRCFSIASAPEDGLPLRVTLKDLPGGRLGAWAARSARVGDVVELGPASGDFVLPDELPGRLLFVSGGSGITPIMSLVRHLLAHNYTGEIAWLHYARRELLFGSELAVLARRHPELRFVSVLTAQPKTASGLRGRISLPHLDAVAPHWTRGDVYACGPNGMLVALRRLARERGVSDRLHIEQFTPALAIPAARPPARCTLTFAKTGGAVTAGSGSSLLVQAEQAGLRPPYGCRMGVCHSCKCKKLSGIVRNELTGTLSVEPGEEIQLCISTPCSDVTLEL